MMAHKEVFIILHAITTACWGDIVKEATYPVRALDHPLSNQ